MSPLPTVRISFDHADRCWQVVSPALPAPLLFASRGRGAAGLIGAAELVGPTDEQLLYEIERRAGASRSPVAMRLSRRWLPALRNRRLPKRALELNAA